MWTNPSLFVCFWFASVLAGGRGSLKQDNSSVTKLSSIMDSKSPSLRTANSTVPQYCGDVFGHCRGADVHWTRCYETKITACTPRARGEPGFIYRRMTRSQEVEVSPTPKHRVYIPSSAFQSRSRAALDLVLVVTVLDSSYFKLSPPRRTGRGRKTTPVQPVHVQGTVMGGTVLVVKAGDRPVRNLTQPIELTFKHNKTVENGICVFWRSSEMEDGTGHWSTDGCDTRDDGSAFVCGCNHLSFFAVLVNPALSVSEQNAMRLSYITYAGSALSALLTVVSLIIYTCLQRRRPGKAISIHMHLSAALLCLHLSFLLCSFWLWRHSEEDLVCQALGLLLHWSLLATVTWMALEGFHLYLLLVQVFNIYVRRYLLKLSLVGWGLPTLIAVVCGISGVYGKYSLELRGASSHNSTAEICWMSDAFPHRRLVTYITTMAFPGLVAASNCCMLAVVAFKLREQRGGGRGGSDKERGSRLWKDCVTVVALSCVLGIPWGLAGTTYLSIAGVYIFTILNSLQGIFVFLWCAALTCKHRSDAETSARDPSSQKIMTTSFNT